MNFGFAFIILLAMIGASMGMFYIAANAPQTANVDAYSRIDGKQENITRGNVTAAAPVGMNLVGYGAVIVALIIVVIAAWAVIASMNHGTFTSRRY